MAVTPCVVDTSAWIEWLADTALGRRLGGQFPDQLQCIVPTIVQLELSKWMAREVGEDQADQVIAYTQKCVVVPLDTVIALLAADLHRECKLATADAIVHATARCQGASLLAPFPKSAIGARGGARSVKKDAVSAPRPADRDGSLQSAGHDAVISGRYGHMVVLFIAVEAAMLRLALALLLLTAAQNAAAEPPDLAPAGWRRSERNGLVLYKAPTGVETMLLAEIPADRAKAMAVLQNVAETLAETSGGRLARSSTQFDETLATFAFEFAKAGATMRGVAFGVARPNGKTLGLIHIGEAATPGFATRNAEVRTKMTALAAAAAPAAAEPAPAAAEAADTPAASGYSAGDLETVVFDVDYAFGVGGYAYPEYRPVYLFRDGSACKCGERAVEELSLAAARAKHRSRVGRWRRSGRGYAIAYEDGSEETVDPDVSPPIPLPEGFVLDGRYQSVGGGGNLAFGGEVLTTAVEDLVFYPDGSFGQSNFASGNTTNITAWAKRGAAGTWSLEGPTLTLHYRDGRSLRTSLFYTASGATIGRMPDVLWIGGEAYKLKEMR